MFRSPISLPWLRLPGGHLCRPARGYVRSRAFIAAPLALCCERVLPCFMPDLLKEEAVEAKVSADVKVTDADEDDVKAGWHRSTHSEEEQDLRICSWVLSVPWGWLGSPVATPPHFVAL